MLVSETGLHCLTDGASLICASMNSYVFGGAGFSYVFEALEKYVAISLAFNAFKNQKYIFFLFVN